MNSQSSNPLQRSLDQIQSNPLLTRLPQQLGPWDLACALRYHPITPKNIQAISFGDRTLLVDEYKKIFIPTTQALAITLSLQSMIYGGLAQRDPRQSAARSFIYEAGQLKGEPLPDQWWPSFAKGMVIEGITGTGKSQIVDRYLSLYPQMIEQGPNPECGWACLKQLVWLKIHMPADSSRGGLLLNGLLELDRVLGTDYTAQYQSSRWTVEKLLVVFLHLLAVHRCGLLVIEEAQERNLSQAAFGRDFVTFFLRLLNWGIPTVLIGNPLAFTKLRDFSQDVDRFSEGGWFHLNPLMDYRSDEWTKDWLPGLWKPTLLDKTDADYIPVSDEPIDQSLAGFIWRRTAGVPRYVCRLRREVQDAALRAGASQISTRMVEQIYWTSEKMTVLHPRIDALVNKDWRALQRFDDIPWDYFRRLWNPVAVDDTDHVGSRVQVKIKPLKSKAVKGIPAKQTPRATKANPAPKERMSPEEILAKQFQDEMATSLAKAAGIDSA